MSRAKKKRVASMQRKRLERLKRLNAAFERAARGVTEFTQAVNRLGYEFARIEFERRARRGGARA